MEAGHWEKLLNFHEQSCVFVKKKKKRLLGMLYITISCSNDSKCAFNVKISYRVDTLIPPVSVGTIQGRGKKQRIEMYRGRQGHSLKDKITKKLNPNFENIFYYYVI